MKLLKKQMVNPLIKLSGRLIVNLTEIRVVLVHSDVCNGSFISYRLSVYNMM